MPTGESEFFFFETGEADSEILMEKYARVARGGE